MALHKSNKGKRKLTKFGRAVTLDRAVKDINGKFAGRKKGVNLFLAGKSISSGGVLFTGKELLRAKKRAISAR